MKKEKNIEQTVIIILFVLAISLMTIGFAAYGKTVNFGGTATLRGNGRVYISNVQKGTLVNADANPEYTESSVDFNLTFTTNEQVVDDNYSAEFDITITNDSVYDYVYSMPAFSHRINRQSNGGSIDPSYLAYTISGIDTRDIIPAKTSVTFTITFTFSNPLVDNQYDTFVIDGDFEPTVTQEIVERLYASVDETTIGDLRGNNTITTAYTITVMNTYSTQKTFTITLDTNKFDIKDENMNNTVSYTIDANDPGQTYTFYIAKKTGTDHFTDTERVGIMVETTGQSQFTAGRVTVLVDQTNYYRDENAPLISNVSAEIVNTEGSAKITWSGRDLETYPTGYTVIAFDSDDNEIKRTSTQSDETELTMTGLSAGEYYFVVIGTDEGGNTATAAEITNATTSEGHACKSNNVTLKWRYTVTFNLTNIQSKSQDTAIRGTNYTTRLNANTNYTIDSMSITIGGNTATQDVEYAFNQNNSSITIYGQYITGDIVVTASASRCLVEGTKILLANGTYKNIEDIKYWDLLKVYDHVNGGVTEVYPIWMEKQGESSNYTKIEFDDGNILKVVNSHSLFDVDKLKYVDISNKEEFGIGSRVYKLDNNKLKIVTVTNIQNVQETVKYYNVVSTGYYNIIANDLLTTDTTSSISNIYGFNEDATYSENYYKISKEDGLDYKDISFIPYYLYKGLNLRNAKTLIGNSLDTNFLSSFVNRNTLEPITKNGEKYFIITTSKDKVNEENLKDYLYKENSVYQVPKDGAKYYIETSTNNKYLPGDKIKVQNSIHLKAIEE